DVVRVVSAAEWTPRTPTGNVSPAPQPPRAAVAALTGSVSLDTADVVRDVRAGSSAPPIERPRPRSTHWVFAAAALLVFGALVTIALWQLRRPPLPASTLLQLSSERWAGAGSFSPDGTQIAYALAGDDGVNWDIRLKIVGEPESRRLTTDPAPEDFPAWSPDGKQIAFLRYANRTFRGLPGLTVGTVHLISPLGGPARQLSGFPARLALSWSPDGRWLAASRADSGDKAPGGIHLISMTGEAHAVTFPKPPAFDVSPAFSPDGRALAY